MGQRDDVIFTLEEIDDLDELERQWRDLEAEAASSFFLSWNWIGSLLETVPPETRPRLLRGTAAGRTVVLALLGEARMRRHRIIRVRRWVLNATGDPAFDCVYVEKNGLLAHPEIGWGSLLDTFSGTKAVDELSLPGVSVSPSVHQTKARGLLRSDRQERSFAVDLGALADSSGDVTAILSSNARSQLRRALRKLEPITVEPATSEREALANFQVLKDLHIPWWERKGVPHAFVHGFFERFHIRVIERGFSEGAVQLSRFRSGDRTFGILYNFHRAGQISAYQSGFTQPQANERPGFVAHALAIEKAWRDGADVYDFLAGENQLKRSFANRTETLSWTVIQKPRLLFRAEHLLKRSLASDAVTGDAVQE